MLYKAPMIALLLSIALPQVACKDDATKGSGAESSPEPAASTTKAPVASKDRDSKDRGQAAMKLGGADWSATRCKAKLRDSGLTIRASSTQMLDGKVARQELHLRIDDYKGPGDYVTGLRGSRYIGVGIDTDAAKAAEGDDKAATEVAKKALGSSDHMMLSSAKVHIEAASETEIRGSFSWQPPAGSKQPAITEGTFRARL